MVYALIDLAKRIDQKLGLSLWSTTLYHTTLPKTYDYRDLERLKTEILKRWIGGFTNIYDALEQAKRYNDKLFFVFTDGDVRFEELIDVDNVLFFLIEPYPECYREFVNRYGKQIVIKIDDIQSIPKIAIDRFVSLFMRG